MLAIIPARGGSKGLPGKNIKELLGRPLIAYSIEAALKATSIDKVVVSTDCAEIAEIALKYGAEIPFLRPANLSSDTALAIDNYIYTIERYAQENSVVISEFCVLQPTSPLRIAQDIDNAINLYREKTADSVVSYTEELHPIKWHKYVADDGRFENIFDVKIENRQVFKPSYYPNGAVFVFNYNLIKQKKYYSQNSYAYIMPRERSVDIDTMSDFKLAEYLIREKNGQ